MLRVAHTGKRWFDRMVLSAPMIDLPGHRTGLPARALLRVLRLTGQGGRYVPGGSDELVNTSSSSTIPDQRSRALRPHAAILEEDRRSVSPHRRWPGRYRVPRDARLRVADYPSRIRQPILMLAASNDSVVSTSAIEEFAYHLRAGSHLVIAGAKHEILQEQDRYRGQFWAAFDAFVPGTSLFK